MIPWAMATFWGKEQHYVAEALASTWVSDGAFVARLEREFGDLVDRPLAVSAANGTAALEMAYLALGVGPGDEVIVPGFCFLAAANVALRMGALPVFAEVDPDTWCLDPRDVERCLSPRTRVVVAVHTYGNVCALDDLLSLVKGSNAVLLEDAAEALGSKYKGAHAGAIALHGCFSFQATKTITTGEGGMVVTTDPAVYARMKLFRNHGMQAVRYRHELAGLNFRLTNLQAALGCAQLEAFEMIVAHRKRIHAQYRKQLGAAPGVTLQQFSHDVDPVLWACAVRLDPAAFPQGRDTVMQELKEAGIESRPGFYSPTTMPSIYGECRSIPVSDRISREVLSLPTFATLSPDQIEAISSALVKLRR